MKKSIGLILLLSLVLGAYSCKDDQVNDNGKLDPNAMINLRPAAGTVLRSATTPRLRSASIGPEHLTALEIVLQTVNLKFWNEPIFGHQFAGRGFDPLQRDTLAPMLKMWGSDIISQFGLYVPDFIEAEDCVLERLILVKFATNDTVIFNPIICRPFEQDYDKSILDTIAYIPNSVLRNAEIQIKAAYANNDFTTVYELFNTAFTFIPITGPEWRDLKSKGLN